MAENNEEVEVGKDIEEGTVLGGEPMDNLTEEELEELTAPAGEDGISDDSVDVNDTNPEGDVEPTEGDVEPTEGADESIKDTEKPAEDSDLGAPIVDNEDEEIETENSYDLDALKAVRGWGELNEVVGGRVVNINEFLKDVTALCGNVDIKLFTGILFDYNKVMAGFVTEEDATKNNNQLHSLLINAVNSEYDVFAAKMEVIITTFLKGEAYTKTNILRYSTKFKYNVDEISKLLFVIHELGDYKKRDENLHMLEKLQDCKIITSKGISNLVTYFS